jgi:hypothetical protein
MKKKSARKPRNIPRRVDENVPWMHSARGSGGRLSSYTNDTVMGAGGRGKYTTPAMKQAAIERSKKRAAAAVEPPFTPKIELHKKGEK